MQNLQALQSLLKDSKNIAIIPHRKPDADALGSCLALAAYLKAKGHQPTVVSPTDYPKFLFWMPGNDQVVNYERDKEAAVQSIEQAELIFCLDFSSLDRIDKLEQPVADSKAVKVLIDHHRGKEDFADFELHNIEASATAELIYEFIELMGDLALIDREMASCIYAGIMTDTGSFKFPSTSSKTHRIIANLKDLGLDSSRIHNLVYDNSTENRLRFLGYALYNRLFILPEYNTAYFAITKEEQKRFSSQTGDTEGLVNYALSLEGIVLAAMFIEKNDHTKMSFRSVGEVNVANLAEEYFDGGGHKNAAGGIQMNKNLEEVVDKFKSVLPKFKETLNQFSTLKATI